MSPGRTGNARVSMIMVESRFRVANGMEDAVRNAFLSRPGFVDGVIGFLGIDVQRGYALILAEDVEGADDHLRDGGAP